jgi:DNA-binding NarL/FixJ family response regulator
MPELSNAPVDVLIIEDEKQCRVRLAEIIRNDARFHLVGEAENCQVARRLFKRYRPKVVITDLGLPDGKGEQLILEFSGNATCHLLVYSNLSDSDRVLDAIKLGAQGYLLKEDDELEIMKSIIQMLQGGAPISPRIAALVLDMLRPKDSMKNQDKIDLTARESEILTLISKGYTTAESADILSLKYNTVASYIKTIYQKLNVNSRSQALFEAQQQGLLSR